MNETPTAQGESPLNGQNPIHVLSLGAGVQSSTMALMAAHGEITPMPSAAIFADTQDEPPSVYEWLAWLEKQLPFPVYRITHGKLSETSLRVRTSKKTEQSYLSHLIPSYTVNADGSNGNMRRQCTDKHKISIIKRCALKIAKGRPIIQWIGFSLEEVGRMKPHKDSRFTNRWPLIDLRMRRWNCITWMERHGFQKPPRSACEFCPYHSDNEWMRLKTEEPVAFNRAVAYEKNLQSAFRKVPRLTSVPYLHDSRVPLDQVQFSEDRNNSLFGNECEGMCGV